MGVAALAVSIWLLSRQLRSLSFHELEASLAALPPTAWLASFGSAVTAYMFLASYDNLALLYLKKKVSPLYASTCGAATYAFAHTVGASVVSGAIIRYRAYSAKGLTGAEIATLVGFCTFTFVLGLMALAGLILIVDPFIVDRFTEPLPINFSSGGRLLVGLAMLYFIFSLLPLPALKIRNIRIAYPASAVTLLQLFISTAEIICAAMIIYFALPAEGNPGAVVVTGVFVLSFAAALVSHSPGGLGVFELVFVTGLSDMNGPDVLAALLVFRLFYFVLPFVCSLAVMSVFEFGRKS
ncbi:UPF0104 family protein [Rhizobium leguminosarum]|nr:UPF0104 family protein [Rhizobium ruizarguesonis]NEJ39756.1 UPF0104 family protein [Rhizobium ruizarguesonis]